MLAKKGQLLIGAIFIIVLIIGAVIVFARTKVGGGADLPSITPVKCDKPPKMPVSIIGTLFVGDKGILFDTEPSIVNFKVDSIDAGGEKFLAIGVEEFQYQVYATNIKTGGKIGRSFEGTGIIKRGQDKMPFPYALEFDIPDNDCNGRVDDFQIELHASISGKDVTGVTQAKGLIQFREGELVR